MKTITQTIKPTPVKTRSLTLFTQTHKTTASQYIHFDVPVAANAKPKTPGDYITLSDARRARHTRALKESETGFAPTLRIPFPTNDNMSPLRARSQYS